MRGSQLRDFYLERHPLSLERLVFCMVGCVRDWEEGGVACSQPPNAVLHVSSHISALGMIGSHFLHHPGVMDQQDSCSSVGLLGGSSLGLALLQPHLSMNPPSQGRKLTVPVPIIAGIMGGRKGLRTASWIWGLDQSVDRTAKYSLPPGDVETQGLGVKIAIWIESSAAWVIPP
ncbi:uncharacterized protein BJX67DRAFT_81216 [Aspergillus lucknowensis]|uniref:Uncharacterized protein n=1 Tax=Aspergillus lucknowensis TaxID=176173 RepID=A0ABR4LRX4_9EURO